MIGDVQPLPGYCLLLADPVADSLNAFSEPDRAAFLLDTARIGDALLEATGAVPINYETWGNSEPALHTHIVPRYAWEEEGKRRRPACMGYDWAAARPFDPVSDRTFMDSMRVLLSRN